MLTGTYLENIMLQLTQEDIANIHRARNMDLAAVNPQMEKINCPLCGGKSRKILVELEGQGSLGQCKKCKVVYAYERPTLGISNALYRYYLPSNLTDYDIRKSQLETRPKELNEDIDCVECYVDRGKLLDVGASSGDFLVYARARGWEVEATELSELCANFMAETLNVPVLLGNILDIKFDKKKYNAITLRHSVEHLREPIKELKVLYDALDDDGILLITTPEHAKDLALVTKEHMLPLHLVNYTKDTLDVLLSKTRFKRLSYESQETGKDIKNMRVVAVKLGDVSR